MATEAENSLAMTVSTPSGGEASASSSGNQEPLPLTVVVKKKRNLPGMPDPDAEVIALSPKTLMATNRFVCEICNKGFQRDQNLQLHRRGHNLPWKLRQRANKEVRKRVYVCPEVSCVHHDPSRALGDLTGIKKHFCRKHGEKKWKCEKCSKKYAVQSDWKAHLKTCGTKEYRCECGTVFSRRDSFVTHRAFCEALAEESCRDPIKPTDDIKRQKLAESPLPLICAAPPSQKTELQENSVVALHQNPHPASVDGSSNSSNKITGAFSNVYGSPSGGTLHQNPPPASVDGGNSSSKITGAFNSVFSSPLGGNSQPRTSAFSDLVCSASLTSTSVMEPPILCLSSNSSFTLFGTSSQDGPQYARPSQPAMSATALLQKAAEMGAASSNSSFLQGLGLSTASSLGQQESLRWNPENEANTASESASIGHGLGYMTGGGVNLRELMLGPSLLFGSKDTHDFLGLQIGLGGGSSTPRVGGAPALVSSIGGSNILDGAAGTSSSIREGSSEVKTE